MYQKYQNLFREINEIQKDKVSIDEIKVDRDQRIDKLRGELNEVTEDLERVNKEHAALEVKYQWLADEFSK